MNEPTQAPTDLSQSKALIDDPADTSQIEEELLVEEISIDGMCGVY